ncbi:MAG: NAD(P)-dependent oxidoreductase [Chloroflexi bacterium]|nr:NAD(P)-dependent oxidoreductase [Chloroflexota bacterium]
MTALITGIGYIGAALAEALLADGERVVGLENGFSTVPAVVRRLARRPGFQLVRGSINSARTLEHACVAATADGSPLDAVYHLAAQASAHPQAAPPSYTEQTNLVAPRLVYEAAVRHGARALVYGSSFRVYGDYLAGVVGEDTPYGQIGDLSHLSKVYAEKLLEMLAAQHPLPAVSVRLGVVYGLGPLMKHDPRFLTVPNLFSLRAVEGQPLTVHPSANRPIGFLHLDDAVQSLRVAARLAQAEAPGAPSRARAVNAVSEVLSVGEVAATVEREAAARRLPTRIEGAGPLTSPRWSVASSLDAAGFRPARTMSESLGAVLDYYAGGRQKPAVQ